MERVVVIAHREIGDGWRALLVRRYAQPRWALAWFDGAQLVGDGAEGVAATHDGLLSLVGDLSWTAHDQARAAFEDATGGPVERGHTLWVQLGEPVEPPDDVGA